MTNTIVTTTNTTSTTRTQPKMKNAEIKKAAHKQGFAYARLITCPDCRADVMEIYGNDAPPWVNVGIALYCTKKGHSPIVACRCGHRSTMKMNFKNSDKIRCKVRGCNHVLTKTDSDGLCVPCRNEIAGGGNPARYSKHCTANLTREGCLHYMQGGNADCVRVQCPNYQPTKGVDASTKYTKPIAQPEAPTTQATVPTKECSRATCHNRMPIGRKTVCDACKAQPKEPVSSQIYQ